MNSTKQGIPPDQAVRNKRAEEDAAKKKNSPRQDQLRYPVSGEDVDKPKAKSGS